MADGPPSAAELALLAPFRARLPLAVFGPPIIPPVSDGTGQDRALLRSAVGLLREAGWTVVEVSAGDSLPELWQQADRYRSREGSESSPGAQHEAGAAK
jgi:ABC-type oligopeptide transport system substrate-binding subunit